MRRTAGRRGEERKGAEAARLGARAGVFLGPGRADDPGEDARLRVGRGCGGEGWVG